MSYARAVEAEAIIEREGAIISEPIYYNGKPVAGVTRLRKHPAVTVAARSWLLLKAFAVEFGLTPAARTRVSKIT